MFDISETFFQAMPITFAVKIVPLKAYIIFASQMNLTFTQGHNYVSNLTIVLLVPCSSIISRTILILNHGIHLWHSCRLMHGTYMVMLISMNLTLMQGHSGLAEGGKSALNYLDH